MPRLSAQGGWRALELGRIANLTLLPPGQGREQQPVQGWDCGPANTLLDLAAEHFSGGSNHFDEGGRWACKGRCMKRWCSAGCRNRFSTTAAQINGP